MIGLISAMCGIFLGPLAVAYIITDRQIREFEKEEKRLRKMEKYGISEEDLTMNVKR